MGSGRGKSRRASVTTRSPSSELVASVRVLMEEMNNIPLIDEHNAAFARARARLVIAAEKVLETERADTALAGLAGCSLDYAQVSVECRKAQWEILGKDAADISKNEESYLASLESGVEEQEDKLRVVLAELRNSWRDLRFDDLEPVVF